MMRLICVWAGSIRDCVCTVYAHVARVEENCDAGAADDEAVGSHAWCACRGNAAHDLVTAMPLLLNLKFEYENFFSFI